MRRDLYSCTNEHMRYRSSKWETIKPTNDLGNNRTINIYYHTSHYITMSLLMVFPAIWENQHAHNTTSNFKAIKSTNELRVTSRLQSFQSGKKKILIIIKRVRPYKGTYCRHDGRDSTRRTNMSTTVATDPLHVA